MAWKPVAAGVRSDCDKLINQFVASDSIRYEEFAKIWREMKMSFIFYGRDDERELCELVEEMFKISKNMWLSDSDVQVRMGGFYLLYAFYMKQPSATKVKIRLTTNEWPECMVFVRFLFEEEHWDAAYIFQTLMTENAFHFVCLPLELHPKMEATDLESYGKDERLKFENLLLNYANDGNFQQLQTFHERYESMKQQIIPEHFPNDRASLDVISNDMVADIKRLIADYEMKIEGGGGAEEWSQPNSSKGITEQNIGAHRVLLKEKQFSKQSSKSTKGLMHRIPTELPDNDSEEQSSTQQKIKQPHKYTWHKTVLESSDSEEIESDSQELDSSEMQF